MHQLSSSPSRRVLKNAKSTQGLLPGFDGGKEIEIFRDAVAYPSPAPTSSVGVHSSSAPSTPVKKKSNELARPPLQQMLVIRLPLTGQPVTIGRSSKSSNFALKATNKLASRVHAKIWYAKGDFVVIECLGYNGLVVYVPGSNGEPESYDVVFNQQIWIEKVDGIFLEVAGDRALIEYEPSTDSDLTEDLSYDENAEQNFDVPSSPAQMMMPSSSAAEKFAADVLESLHNSPAPPEKKPENETVTSTEPDLKSSSNIEITEPIGKSPVKALEIIPDSSNKEQENRPTNSSDQVSIENASSPGKLNNNNNTEQAHPKLLGQVKESISESQDESGKTSLNESILSSNPVDTVMQETNEAESTLSQPSGPNEELHENPLVSKEEEQPASSDHVAAHKHKRSHKRHRSEALTLLPPSPVKKVTPSHNDEEVRNIVINHVAFSRLTSTPLSDIIDSSRNLQRIPRVEVERILAETPSVGIIPREGKDALGKPLEAEYYYMIENDPNQVRRELVEDAKGHRTLRSCRRSHKQYYYKKPPKR